MKFYNTYPIKITNLSQHLMSIIISIFPKAVNIFLLDNLFLDRYNAPNH